MAVHFEQLQEGKVLEVRVSGTLSHEDYLKFLPEFERIISKHGKVRVLFDMVDFHGWNLGALWDDLKLDFRHHADLERVAMVGDKKWEQAMAGFCRPFTSAEVRYFDHTDLDAARTWISEGLVQSESSVASHR